MKRKLLFLLMTVSLILSSVFPVFAETERSDENWQIVFTADKKMQANFSKSDLQGKVFNLQPGDTAIITLGLKNSYSLYTDWYMTNAVIESLEDSSANAATGGGAYTYILTYKDPSGEETVLFSSDTVGGEDASGSGLTGLHSATSGLEDYFYLDTLNSGESGSVTLQVSLDGETQGNDYQDTLAELQMNFAVELGTTSDAPEPTTAAPTTPDTPDTPVTPETTPASPTPTHELVKTGDDTALLPLYAAAFFSGLLLLVLAIYLFLKTRPKKKRRNRE